jgi:hypothetical protein
LWFLLTYRFKRPKLTVLNASFSADDSVIDIRYWLSRPDKIDPKTRPYLINAQNQKLGLMYFPKFGVMQSKIRKHTNTGILLFYNKNKTINIDNNRVTLCWDGLKAENIVVQ